MFSDLIATIPAEFAKQWYIYDLILFGLIIIFGALLVITKIRSTKASGIKNIEHAIEHLEIARRCQSIRSMKLNLYIAKNETESAYVNFDSSIKEKDRHELTECLDPLYDCRENLEKLSNNLRIYGTSVIVSQLDAISSVLKKLLETVNKDTKTENAKRRSR
ncbi:MAG: hypothetical protein LBU04_04850 [Christensenellaceae bacterium]|jgi:hypothetical protein|nr:hypothetical protein [Christensenellaceae bacterium]